jgi:uncharacterized protein (DUF983 family)
MYGPIASGINVLSGRYMTEHNKKIIAPVVVVICIILYYCIGVHLLIQFTIPTIIKIAALVFSVFITIICIAVLIERIKEIKQGEADDLGKY